MKTIYKYPVPLDDDQILTLRGRVLSAGLQGSTITLWAVYDEAVRERSVRVSIRGTGHPFGDVHESDFVATLFQGPFVWHVFATELS